MSQPARPGGVGRRQDRQSASLIKVTVKTLKQKEQFEVAESSTVQAFKEDVAKRFKAPPDLLVLIFAGKILQDQETLIQHGVRSGFSLHLVIRSQKRPQDSLAEQTDSPTGATPSPISSVPNPLASARIVSSDLDLNTINSNPFLLGFLIGVTGMTVLGMDPTDVSDLASEATETEVSMENLMSEVGQTPFVQSILANADLREIVLASPQMQQLAEQNPEFHQLLHDPDFIREMIEVSRSPAMMQEVIRNHDRALSNLESLPGGYSALQQLYSEIEEPMMNAVQAQFGNNPFAPLENNPPLGGVSPPARMENRDPLPNPWATRPNRAGNGSNSFESNRISNGVAQSFIVLNLGPGAGHGAASTGGIQSMAQQLAGKPGFMQNMESVLLNPDGPAQNLLVNTCLSGHGHAQPQEERPPRLPPQLESAEISSLLSSPRAMQALLQIQLGLQTLSAEVPDFILGLGDHDVELELESMEGSVPSSESEEDVSLASEKEEPEGHEHMDQETPEVRFEQQMEQLRAMGFQDRAANIQALIDAEGEINAAIEMLTKSQPSSKIL
uniref:Ubiquilin-1 n=1 Tax=Pelusios castaneus TaxID=367368 RepID=A0A8C8RET8_9SAUR